MRANLMRKAMRLEGRVWERKVLQGAPAFRPLNERHAAVVSVLNLKGGVGKTTTTAHLGAAFAAKGYRVLLLDLDLQGSLSSLFIHETALVERSREKGLLQHFLTAAAEGRKVNLLEYISPILGGKSGIVPTADSMVYAELNLTMQWLLRLGKKDTRFLLRKALHQRRVTRLFDIVLLDCPPLFNTCCVNALAASDYVLIPVTPSNKAAERVPLLLDRLKGLCRVINPELQVAGVLLNRTRGSASLTGWEKDLRKDLMERCQDRWKLPVYAFETFIRDITPEVRDSEQEFSPPAPGSSCTPCSPSWRPSWKRGCPVTVAELQLLLSDLGKFLRAPRPRRLPPSWSTSASGLPRSRGTSSRRLRTFSFRRKPTRAGRWPRRRRGEAGGRKTPPPLRGRVSASFCCTSERPTRARRLSKSRMPCGSWEPSTHRKRNSMKSPPRWGLSES